MPTSIKVEAGEVRVIFAGGSRRRFERARGTARWLLWIVPVAAASARPCARFLRSLDAATKACSGSVQQHTGKARCLDQGTRIRPVAARLTAA